MDAKDKWYAFKAFATPYFFINVMLYSGSKYSQLWEENVIMFLLLVGFLMTSITGTLNLKSSAKMRLNIIYPDPFAYLAILYCDYNRIFSLPVLKMMYFGIMLNRTLQYFLFMRGMVNQICDHLDIPFLIVKEDYVSKKSKKIEKKKEK